jgi:hypothetical protein
MPEPLVDPLTVQVCGARLATLLRVRLELRFQSGKLGEG